uniref:C2H2-type domain-containing protein n=1 Tax=Strongyloides venezuelensis TaxID=75913 RepID=A0A0K0FBU5_STRVS
MDKLSSNVDCQFCNRKVEKSRYLYDLRDTHEYADDRFLKVIVCSVFECKTKDKQYSFKNFKIHLRKFQVPHFDNRYDSKSLIGLGVKLFTNILILDEFPQEVGGFLCEVKLKFK